MALELSLLGVFVVGLMLGWWLCGLGHQPILSIGLGLWSIGYERRPRYNDGLYGPHLFVRDGGRFVCSLTKVERDDESDMYVCRWGKREWSFTI
jgi:hypothetical protein